MGDSNTFIKPSPLQPLLARKQVKRRNPSKPSTKVYISKDVGYCMAPASFTEFNKATDQDAPFILTRSSILDLMESLKSIKESEDHFNSGMKLFQQGLSILENVLLKNMKMQELPEISNRVHDINLNITLPQPTSLPATFVKEHKEVPAKSSVVLTTGCLDDNILVNSVHQSASKHVKQDNALNVDQSESIDVDCNTDVGVSGQGALSSKRNDLSDVVLKDDSSIPKLKKHHVNLKDCSVLLERVLNGKKGKVLQADYRTNPSTESTTDEHIYKLNENIGEDGQRFTRTDSRRCRILNNILSSSDEDELVNVDTQDCTMLQKKKKRVCERQTTINLNGNTKISKMSKCRKYKQGGNVTVPVFNMTLRKREKKMNSSRSQRKPKDKISVSPAKYQKSSQSLQKGWKRSRTKIDEFTSKKSQSTKVEKLPKANKRLQMDGSHQANMTVGNHGHLSLRHRPSLLVEMFGLSNASSAGRKLDKSHEKKTVAYKLNKTNITTQHKPTKRGRSNVQKDSIDCLSEDDSESEKENDWGPIMPITTKPLSDVSSGHSTTPPANYYNILDGSMNSLHSAHSSPGMPMFHSNKEATHLINKHVKDKEKASKRSRPTDNTTKVTEDNPKPWSEMKKAVKKLSHLKPVDDDSNLSDASTCIYTSFKFAVNPEDSLDLSDKTSLNSFDSPL